jgi:hypothetical protein
MAALAETKVARRPDVSIKLDGEVVRMAKLVATYRQTTMAEYLSEILRPIVRHDLEEEQRKDLGGSSPPKAQKPARPKREK